MIPVILFYLFGFTAVFFALGVVFHRHPVINALSMVGVIVSLAGLFYLLNAPFLALLQIIVYAGAIIVLFLFVIMLLNLRKEEGEKEERPIHAFFAWLGVFLCLGGIYFLMGKIILPFSPVSLQMKKLANMLFSVYALPFEAVTVLLILSLVGAFILVRRREE